MKKILLLDDNHPVLEQGLVHLGYHCDRDFTSFKSEIEQKIAPYTGIVIRSRFKIDRTFLDAAKNLKFIARVGAGVESIDRVYAAQKGITLIAAPEGNRNAVGEHTLGMLLSLLNHLNRADRQIRKGKWLREANRGAELDGKTVGIIGYGNMGKAFAKKLRGFDVNVVFHDLLPDLSDGNAKQVSLKELQEQADIVSIHTDDNPLSYKMVNHDFIEAFSKPFYFLNTARGSAVVTEDLVKSLQNGKILAAGLDVLEWEKTSFENLFENKNLPPAFDYLVHADNVLLTPHIAGWTVESKIKLAEVIVEKIQKLDL